MTDAQWREYVRRHKQVRNRTRNNFLASLIAVVPFLVLSPLVAWSLEPGGVYRVVAWVLGVVAGACAGLFLHLWSEARSAQRELSAVEAKYADYRWQMDSTAGPAGSWHEQFGVKAPERFPTWDRPPIPAPTWRRTRSTNPAAPKETPPPPTHDWREEDMGQ